MSRYGHRPAGAPAVDAGAGEDLAPTSREAGGLRRMATLEAPLRVLRASEDCATVLYRKNLAGKSQKIPEYCKTWACAAREARGACPFLGIFRICFSIQH